MKITVSDDKKTIFIAGAATVHHVENLYTGLVDVLNHNKPPLAIDLNGITSVDISGAQVFASLKRSYGTASIKYVNCPAPIGHKLTLVGLAQLLFGGAEV